MLRKKASSRIYGAEKISYALIRWLNHAKDRKSVARIVSVIKSGTKLNKLTGPGNLPIASLNPQKQWPVGSKGQIANWRESSKLVRELNRSLSKYKMYPNYSQSRDSLWHVSWICLINTRRLNIQVFAGGDYSSFLFGEGDAVASVIRLAEQGYLERVRKCRCNKWFYARFRHQLYCGTPCQQRDFRTTEEFRAHHREYMRIHRERLAKRSGRRFRHRVRNV